MIDFENQTNYKLDVDFLNQLKDSLTGKDIELLLVENNFMQAINKQTRNKDISTDVLSFPLENMPYLNSLGSIVICLNFVENKAKEFGHSTDDEISLLFIHGLLHLLGFDHEVDNGEMRKKEQEIIEKFNLPKSLIIRSN